MMDLHMFCKDIGMPVLGATALVVGLAGLGVDVMKNLKLSSGARSMIQLAVGLVGLICVVHYLMCCMQHSSGN